MHNGECIPDVFLWALVCMSCLFAMLPSTTDKKKEKLFLSLATGVKLAEWKQTHWLSSRFFSKAERLCNCQQHRAKNIINFWIHPGTGELFPSTQWFPPRRLDANMCTHRNPLNCRHLKISHTHTHTSIFTSLSQTHIQTLTAPVKVHFGGISASLSVQNSIPLAFNYKPDHNRWMEQLFPTSHGQYGRLQIEDDSYTWPRFPPAVKFPSALCNSLSLCNNNVWENSAPDASPALPQDSCYLSSCCVPAPSVQRQKKNRIGWVWLKFLASY